MPDIKLEGNVTGLEDVKKMVIQAPEKFRKAILSMLDKEKKSFIGDNKVNGLFRRSIIRKKTRKGNNFPEKLAKHFKGWIETSTNSLDMNLEMGLLYRNTNSRIKKAMIMLSKGGKITNSKYMPIPNRKDLDVQNTPNVKLYYVFKSLIKSGKLIWMNKRGKNYWLNKDTGKAMFFASKSVTIKQKFDLNKEWEKRVPNLINKYKKSIDKVVERLNKSGAK